MSQTGVTLDFSKAQPITLDFSKAQPVDGPPKPAGTTPQGTGVDTSSGHRVVTPQPGEDFAATMQRGAQMGKTVTPQEIQAGRAESEHLAPRVLGAAALAGPALIGSGAVAPELASTAAGGGVMGGAAGGAAAGGGTSLIGKGLHAAAGDNNESTWDTIKDVAKDTLIGGATGGLIGAGGKLISEFAPEARAARAGSALNDVKAAAGGVPIDTGKVGDAAFEVQRLAGSGGRMPKVVNDFLRRATDPGKGPLTYAEARDFYSNATRISFDEMNTLTPVMKRALGQFTKELGTSIEGAAGQAGQAETYRGAMKDYSGAMRTRDAIDEGKNLIGKAAKVGAGTAIGGYAVKKILDN